MRKFIAKAFDRHWARDDKGRDFVELTGEALYRALVEAALGDDERIRDRALGTLTRLVAEELR